MRPRKKGRCCFFLLRTPVGTGGLASDPAFIYKRAVFGTYRTTSCSRPFVGLARVLRGIGEL